MRIADPTTGTVGRMLPRMPQAGHFHPEKFEDQYEDALKELLRKKQSGQKIEAPKEREPTKVVSLMDALRRSVDAERAGGGSAAGASGTRRPSTARQRRPHDRARARKRASVPTTRSWQSSGGSTGRAT
jgi:hypothetical protein